MAISQITSNSIAAGAVSASDLADASITPAKLSTGAPYWDSSGNVGIGTSSPVAKLDVNTAGGAEVRIGDKTDFTNNVSVYYRTTGSLLQTVGVGGTFSWGINGSSDLMKVTGAGLLQFNSGYGSVATAYGCRAWVNYSSYGSNLIYGSGNVSSVTDLSTGRTRINFTTAMPNTNYAVVYGVGDDQIVWNGGASLASVQNGLKTTGYTSFHVSNNTFSDTEYYEMSIAVFR